MHIHLRRPAALDWPAILAAAYAAAPWAGEQNQEWLANRCGFDDATARRSQYVVEVTDTGQVSGYGAVEEGPERHHFRLFLVMPPHLLASGSGELLYQRLLTDLTVFAAVRVWAREDAADVDLLQFLQAHGFLETQRVLTPLRTEAVLLEWAGLRPSPAGFWQPDRVS